MYIVLITKIQKNVISGEIPADLAQDIQKNY